jgi:IS5 family transposase
MTHQPSFSQAEFADKKKLPRREKFLTRMEAVIPWVKLLASSSLSIPRANADARPSAWSGCCGFICSSHVYGQADEALEDALYDSQALQGFARLELAAEGVLDATTLLKFRRLLEPTTCAEASSSPSMPT